MGSHARGRKSAAILGLGLACAAPLLPAGAQAATAEVDSAPLKVGVLLLSRVESASIRIGVAAPVVPGDLNGDGKVDATDLNRMIQIFLGKIAPTTQDLAAGDLEPIPGTHGRAHGDGVIRADDVNRVFRLFLHPGSSP